MTDPITLWRAELASRREVQRQNYARFRDLGNLACQKFGTVIGYSREKHEFYQRYWSGLRYKELDVIRKLMQLQKNIQQQSMLLLELEHAIDREEAKCQEKSASQNS